MLSARQWDCLDVCALSLRALYPFAGINGNCGKTAFLSFPRPPGESLNLWVVLGFPSAGMKYIRYCAQGHMV